jgi:L,D-transpeptidase catalytic domain
VARLLLLALFVLAGVAGDGITASGPRTTPPAVVVTPVVTTETVPPAAAAPHGLPVIDYWTSPRGFPADPAPRSTADLTVGLRAKTRLVLYDSPGGRPRAYLPSSISGVPVVVPVVARRTGWVAVLLPSVNRRVGWLPATGWAPLTLPDQLVLRRRTHELTWLRDGLRQASWTVAVGTAATPTPLGRTFVLGRTTTHGGVYAGLDALALGSVPDDRHALSAAFRGAHTGIHSWYRADVFGRDTSNGCIRVPRAGQRTLLTNIAPGTSLLVLD